jgi:hypothetical protein
MCTEAPSILKRNHPDPLSQGVLLPPDRSRGSYLSRYVPESGTNRNHTRLRAKELQDGPFPQLSCLIPLFRIA